MKKFAVAVVLSFAILLSGQFSYADAKSELQAEIGALITESKQLNQERDGLNQTALNLDVALKVLAQRDSGLKQTLPKLRQAKLNLDMVKAKINADAAALRAHATCNGTYEPQEYARRKAWCDAEWAKIRVRRQSWNTESSMHNGRVSNYEQAKINLSKDTLNWTADRKQLDTRRYNLVLKRSKWFRRFLTFMTNSSKALNQLKRMAGVSQECANIPGIGEFERRLDGASERAHRCLQVLWDGAKKK